MRCTSKLAAEARKYDHLIINVLTRLRTQIAGRSRMHSILSSQKASEMLRQLFDPLVEEVRVVALGSDKSVINHACIFRGTSDACLFHPRDIFRFAILNCASGFILSHNHPFTSSQPSHDDIVATQRILKTSRTMGIELVDHIIIGKSDYFSFADRLLLRTRAARISP